MMENNYNQKIIKCGTKKTEITSNHGHVKKFFFSFYHIEITTVKYNHKFATVHIYLSNKLAS